MQGQVHAVALLDFMRPVWVSHGQVRKVLVAQKV